MATAIDLTSVAKALSLCGLAQIDGKVQLAPELAIAADFAGGSNLREIARILILSNPPVWLHLAVNDRGVSRDCIPTGDLNALLWLEPILDELLIEAYSWIDARRRIDIQKQIGNAGELFLFSAMRYSGLNPVHVALMSDLYGYDIEVEGVGGVERVEVKAAGPRTAGAFHISRNEFDKSCLYGEKWRLVQIVFNSAAFVAPMLDCSHVEAIFELANGVLQEVVPPDAATFRWEESALVTPSSKAWRRSSISLDPFFATPGFRFASL